MQKLRGQLNDSIETISVAGNIDSEDKQAKSEQVKEDVDS